MTDVEVSGTISYLSGREKLLRRRSKKSRLTLKRIFSKPLDCKTSRFEFTKYSFKSNAVGD